MASTQNKWNLKAATEEALAYLETEELAHYSSRRIRNGHEKLEESARLGFSILKEQGKLILNAFAESEKIRHQSKQ